MPKVTRSFEFEVPAKELWELVSGFHGMPKWHPLILKNKVEDGGRIRHMALKGGGAVKELLTRLDEKGRSMTYVITEGDMPFSGYSSSLSVARKGPRKSTLTWVGNYTPEKAPKEECAKIIAMVYETGAEGIRKHFKLG
ncbi:MAG: SRPBCC family protein [Alphaproteobacteria bacterium]